jgi:hypothetical protein
VQVDVKVRSVLSLDSLRRCTIVFSAAAVEGCMDVVLAETAAYHNAAAIMLLACYELIEASAGV